MNEKYLELRNYLLSSKNEERNGKVSEMTEEQIPQFRNPTKSLRPLMPKPPRMRFF